jgi:Rhamnan synthesis protein F
MNLPPFWKVKREIKRARDDVWRSVRGLLLEPPRQWLYDLRTERSLQPTVGQFDLTGRVVILVLFQPKGLANSVRLTLDHLASQGWSVLVVSNAPLSDKDAAMLTQRAALVLERPNLGYDFGAYRAGIRLLDRMGHHPEKLILLNDSTWFPLRVEDDTLARLEALGAAMAGQIFKKENKIKQNHVESHLLFFSAELLGHPAWRRFWRRFVMSDDRVSTILRGEKGLSQAVMSTGLPVRGLISRESLLLTLDQLSDSDLQAVMNDLVHHRNDAQMDCERLSTTNAWRDGFLNWTSLVLADSRQHLISVTFIAAAMQHCSMGFVKKTSDRRFHLARVKVLEMEAAGHIKPLHPDVRAEIGEAVAVWRPLSCD